MAGKGRPRELSKDDLKTLADREVRCILNLQGVDATQVYDMTRAQLNLWLSGPTNPFLTKETIAGLKEVKGDTTLVESERAEARAELSNPLRLGFKKLDTVALRAGGHCRPVAVDYIEALIEYLKDKAIEDKPTLGDTTITTSEEVAAEAEAAGWVPPTKTQEIIEQREKTVAEARVAPKPKLVAAKIAKDDDEELKDALREKYPQGDVMSRLGKKKDPPKAPQKAPSQAGDDLATLLQLQVDLGADGLDKLDALLKAQRELRAAVDFQSLLLWNLTHQSAQISTISELVERRQKQA